MGVSVFIWLKLRSNAAGRLSRRIPKDSFVRPGTRLNRMPAKRKTNTEIKEDKPSPPSKAARGQPEKAAAAVKRESDAATGAAAAPKAKVAKNNDTPGPESSVVEQLLQTGAKTQEPAAAAAAAPSAPAAPGAPPAELPALAAPAAAGAAPEAAPAATGATEEAGAAPAAGKAPEQEKAKKAETEAPEAEASPAEEATETATKTEKEAAAAERKPKQAEEARKKELRKEEAAKKARGTLDAKEAEEKAKKAAAGAIPISFTAMLEMDTSVDQSQYIGTWAANTKFWVDTTLLAFLRERQHKVGFTVPADVMLVAPLAITAACGGADLKGFREVLHYDNMMLALSKTRQYEAAGTVWMCEVNTDPVVDTLSVSQVESAMAAFSHAAFLQSSSHVPSRHFSFDVPLPVQVVDPKVAQRRAASGADTGVRADTGVLMAQPLPLLAGGALVVGWYAQMQEALLRAHEDEEPVFKLLEAGLSVPIRFKLGCDPDERCLIGLHFSESILATAAAAAADSFWKVAEKVAKLTTFKNALKRNLSIPKLKEELKAFGLTFKGKAFTDTVVKALKALAPFVDNAACCTAFVLMEACCPEMRDSTLLMRIAQLCGRRQPDNADAACESMVFVFDCLRVGRLTGERPAQNTYTVSDVTGQENKQPALVHDLFKKQDAVEFLSQEVALVQPGVLTTAKMYRTPLAIQKYFSALGEGGLVDTFRNATSADLTFEGTFALKVADHRDQEAHGAVTKAYIDFAWGVWAGTFDDDFKELCKRDLQDPSRNVAWHKFLNDNTDALGNKYRAFVAACQSGPVTAPGVEDLPNIPGASEMQEQEHEHVAKIQRLLAQLRRKKVNFVPMPEIGGAVGAEYTKAQLDKLWNDLRLGYSFTRKKHDVRAFVLSAEVFPPNLVKQGASASFIQPLAVDTNAMKRVIEYMLSKRTKDDIILLFDGRSRAARKVIEQYEDKLAAPEKQGAAAKPPVEIWIVYTDPKKQEDPRVPRRQTSFARNNREVAFASLAGRGNTKVQPRAEFNACGETSSTSTTYTGVAPRRFCELPRMDVATKSAILGVAAAGAVKQKAVQRDCDERGPPFSHLEVKPLNLLQRLFEHFGVTHVVDFAAGSAAMAIAAAGAQDYEGIAANGEHRDWLDATLDKCVMYMAGKDAQFSKSLGVVDEDVTAEIAKYFGGALMEARRIMEPPDPAAQDEDAQEVSSPDDDSDDDSDDDA